LAVSVTVKNGSVVQPTVLRLGKSQATLYEKQEKRPNGKEASNALALLRMKTCATRVYNLRVCHAPVPIVATCVHTVRRTIQLLHGMYELGYGVP
jgi:hypothetical protein